MNLRDNKKLNIEKQYRHPTRIHPVEVGTNKDAARIRASPGRKNTGAGENQAHISSVRRGGRSVDQIEED